MLTKLFGAGLAYNLAFGSWSAPKLHQFELELKGLPSAFDGFTIGQISDLHRSPLVPEWLLRRGADLMRECRPDLLVLTGDFVSVSARLYAPSCVRALEGLTAPYGVYSVLGNHDYWTNAQRVIGELTKIGCHTLINESVLMERGGEHLALVGIDDLIAGQPDLDKAESEVPQGVCKILLCHEPDFAHQSARRGYALQLSGHTHGGQCLLPWLGRAVLPELGVMYPAGLHRVPHSDMWVYTNTGLGFVTLPVRHRCGPEVTLITLRCPSPDRPGEPL